MGVLDSSRRILLSYSLFLWLEWSLDWHHGVSSFTLTPTFLLSKNTHVGVSPLQQQPKQQDKTRRKEYSAIQASATPDQQKTSVSRRTMIASAAAAAASCAVIHPAVATSASTTPTNQLQEISIGQGVWTSLDALSTTTDDTTLFTATPTFATYLTRFLIQYDDAVKSWWQQVIESYQLIPAEQRQQALGLAFGSMAKSIQQAFQTTRASSADLYDRFLRIYGNSDANAKRQIAILFALLPPQDQPLAELDVYVKNDKVSSPLLPKLNRRVPSQPRTTTTLFGDDLSRLLPEIFHVTKIQTPPNNNNTPSYYYTIEPTIALYEIGIGQEFGQTAVATAFGPMASTPLVRDRPKYSAKLYGLFGLAGATACCLTHATVIPIDVIKTRAQTANAETKNIFASAISIAEKEGVLALFLGAQATLAGYSWYGLSVYPSYTFSKRSLLGILSPDFGVAHANEVALVAGALAAVVASLGLTPLEAARIRAVADPAVYRPLGLTGTLRVIAKENGGSPISNLYAGLPSLLARQVIFGSVKFLAFERACEWIFTASPGLRDATWTTLAVSLVAGGISGVLSSVVSQPADSLLTYVAKGGTNMGLIEGARTMMAEEGLGSLFRGLGSRCVWAGSIIAGQFLLYDVFRTAFGVSSDSLSQVFQLQI